MKQVRENPESGLAVTIAATKVDGIVLSLTPNSHSYNYRSAVLFGYGSLVEVCILREPIVLSSYDILRRETNFTSQDILIQI